VGIYKFLANHGAAADGVSGGGETGALGPARSTRSNGREGVERTRDPAGRWLGSIAAGAGTRPAFDLLASPRPDSVGGLPGHDITEKISSHHFTATTIT
jgi:hypothetical protein